jgi:hypothetical protein
LAPCIVTFKSRRVKKYHVDTAIYYLYRKTRQEKLSRDTNICFERERAVIPKSDIIKVEFIDYTTELVPPTEPCVFGFLKGREGISMYIPEIYLPGTWLELDDRDTAFEIKCMLDYLVDLVSEAAITLTLFEQASDTLKNYKDKWERDRALRADISEELRVELGEVQFFSNPNRCLLETERRLRSKKIELGITPISYEHKIPFIYAHSFVYAIDSYGKFLDALCEYKGIHEEIRKLSKEFNDRLPMVRKIRNSAHHVEDRLRRYASPQDKKKGKKMKVDGFLGFSNLEGNKLGYTIDDGSYQRIEISEATLSVLVDNTNRVLASFAWKGPPSLAPRC